MSAPAFTPGPWQEMPTEASVDDNYRYCEEGEEQPMNTWVGVGNPGLTDGIVAIAVFDGDHQDPEFNANIALIAAAPDLYAQGEQSATTLEEAANVLEGKGLPSFASICREQASRQRAALAKARGE